MRNGYFSLLRLSSLMILFSSGMFGMKSFGQNGCEMFIRLIKNIPVSDSVLSKNLPINIIISNDSLENQNHSFHEGQIQLYFRQVAFFKGISDVYSIDTFWFKNDTACLSLSKFATKAGKIGLEQQAFKTTTLTLWYYTKEIQFYIKEE